MQLRKTLVHNDSEVLHLCYASVSFIQYKVHGGAFDEPIKVTQTQFKIPSNGLPCMHEISVYFCLNLCKLYDGPIRLLTDHDFTVRCIQVESIARGRHTRSHWMVPLSTHFLHSYPSHLLSVPYSPSVISSKSCCTVVLQKGVAPINIS